MILNAYLVISTVKAPPEFKIQAVVSHRLLGSMSTNTFNLRKADFCCRPELTWRRSKHLS